MDINVIKEKALEVAQKDYSQPLKIVSTGENENFITVCMTNDEVLDGFDAPNYIINKQTGKTLYCQAMHGIETIPGFEGFNWGELSFEYY